MCVCALERRFVEVLNLMVFLGNTAMTCSFKEQKQEQFPINSACNAWENFHNREVGKNLTFANWR